MKKRFYLVSLQKAFLCRGIYYVCPVIDLISSTSGTELK